MIKATGITKSYNGLDVLKGVDVTINKGEVVSIVGPSGAGKTTLLHILGTLDSSDSGSVNINDVIIESKRKLDILPIKWYRRLLGKYIDNFILVGILILIYNYLPANMPEGYEVIFSIIYYSIALIFIFLYYLILEFYFCRSIGKLIIKAKVVSKTDGSKPSFKSIFFRTLSRYIPFDAFSFVNKIPYGWHDQISETIVVDSKFQFLEPGKDSLKGKKLSEFRTKNIGFVFQFHHLLPEFTALENVCIPAYIAGTPNGESIEKAKELLSFLGLSHRMDHKPSELSGGEQQRVAVARALINNPAVVLADEPSGNLDTASAKELHKLFFTLREKFNQTFVIVTHNEELANMADRKLTMRDGLIVS